MSVHSEGSKATSALRNTGEVYAQMVVKDLRE